jgi:hypothetical protein
MSVVGGHEIRNRNVVFTKYDGPIIVPPIRKVGREILGETCDGLLSGN